MNPQTRFSYLRNEASFLGFFGVLPVLTADIDVTMACNLKCSHCFASAGKKLKSEFTLQELEDVFQQLLELGVTEVTVGVALWPTRSPSRRATLSIESSDSFVASTTASIATVWSEPVPGRELHPLKSSAFQRALLHQLRAKSDADGALRLLPCLEYRGAYTWAFGINDSGQVIGAYTSSPA